MIGLGLNELCNGTSHSKRIKNLKVVLDSERYRKAFANLDFSYFPIHWKLFFTFCKKRRILFVYVLLNAIQMMIGK
jgi:glycosyltransferase EpsH